MWSKHCSALFKKQVFPVLMNPQPRIAALGQDMSMVLGYRDFEVEADACVCFTDLLELACDGSEARCESAFWRGRRASAMQNRLHHLRH